MCRTIIIWLILLTFEKYNMLYNKHNLCYKTYKTVQICIIWIVISIIYLLLSIIAHKKYNNIMQPICKVVSGPRFTVSSRFRNRFFQDLKYDFRRFQALKSIRNAIKWHQNTFLSIQTAQKAWKTAQIDRKWPTNQRKKRFLKRLVMPLVMRNLQNDTIILKPWHCSYCRSPRPTNAMFHCVLLMIEPESVPGWLAGAWKTFWRSKITVVAELFLEPLKN